MKQPVHNSKQGRFLSARIGVLAGALLVLGLLGASPASATYEQVGIFAGSATPPSEPGVFPEEVQLGGVSGMAVNVSGAGGVPPGTVYTANTFSEITSSIRVARFNPDGEFSEAWTVRRVEGEYERCGPDGDPAHPVCPARPVGGRGGVDVDVDQSTGNVYVFSTQDTISGDPSIRVYSPDGSEVVTRFGEFGVEGETTAAAPEKMHGLSSGGSVAVDASGTVYVADINYQDNAYHRVMVFKPQTPGDYEHYVYTGQSHDIGAGTAASGPWPATPVVDSAGDVYGAESDRIVKFDPDQPSSLVCEFHFPKDGITAMTVNPETGEVFFFDYHSGKIHQLSPCNAEGEFVETGTFSLAPKRAEITALAVNPSRQYEPSRPAGVLYGGAPNAEGGKTGESSLGYIFAPPEENPPLVVSESVSRVTTTTATLGALINPKGFDTRYSFQYIAEDAYQANEPSDRFAGAAEAPLGGGLLGGGQEALSAAVALAGLAPDTVYHYRAVATSHCAPGEEAKVCEGTGADQTFRTFPVETPGLPDNRAYELVSPAQKHGGEVFPADPSIRSCAHEECKPGLGSQHFPMQSSPDGNAVVYEGFPFSVNGGALIENEYLARRTESGWQTTTLSPALQGSGEEQGYVAFDAELSRGLIYQTNPQLSPEAASGYANLYAQPTASPASLATLLGAGPPNRPLGNSAGFRLTYAGASVDFSRFFFEANDALTEETPFAPAAVDGGASKNSLYEWTAGQLRLVNVAPGNAESAPGGEFGSGKQLDPGGNIHISDFSHAISDDGSRVFWSSEAGQVYVRENGETTKAIPGSGKFLTASADGSKVLLNSGQLHGLGDEEPTVDLTQGKGGFEGIAGQSEDLSRIYFVDTAVLDETPNEQGAKAQAGKDNLYAWREGESVFVGTLLPNDNPGGSGDNIGDWLASPSLRTAEASPDGRWVAFLSKAPLTGYDNTGVCPIDQSAVEGLCPEAFLYDSATGDLTCASCNPSGERPLGPSTLRVIGGAKGSLPQPRYLTDDGRLYFDSQDSLTPFDTNDGVEDVYQFEPEGIGSCKREGGCVSLISAGHEGVDSNFLAADPSGKNVFFTSRDQLVLKDRDELIDLYVAREDGGIAAETETARAECQGEACQAAISPPNDPTPGSSSFEGAGNVDEGKATKKHKKKHKQAKKRKSHKRSHGRANHNRGGAR